MATFGKSFKYKVLRKCYWNDILWNPEENEIVTLYVDTTGIPPHHFEPIDGGPVEAGVLPGEPEGAIVYLPPVDGGSVATLKGLSDQETAVEDALLGRRTAVPNVGDKLKPRR